MGNLARDAHFGMEAGEGAGIARQGGGKEFNGYDLAELKVLGAIDFTHAAAAGEGDDAGAVSDHLAGSEAPAAEGIGARRQNRRAGRSARGARKRSGWTRRRQGR